MRSLTRPPQRQSHNARARRWFRPALLLALCWPGMGPALAQTVPAPSAATPTETPERFGISHGTGFSVGNGYVLTAHHVVKSATRVLVGQGPGQWLLAEVVKTDPTLDLALIRSNSSLPGMRIARSGSVPVGMEIFVIGYPQPSIQGMNQKITQGLVNGHARNSQSGVEKGYFQINAEVSRGNSGGPLIGPDGSVVGMVQRKLDTQRVLERTQEWTVNVSYALRASHLIDFLEGTPVTLSLATVDLSSSLKPYQIYAQSQNSIVPIMASMRSPAPSAGGGARMPLP